jgi:parallel beta-helix repeat protein
LISNIVTNTGPEAIHLHESDNNVIENNTLSLNEFSLHLWGSTGNILQDNNLFQNKFGVKLWFSGNNTLRENNMTGNWWNFAVFGNSIQNYVNDVSTSNTVNNKPICYVVNCHGETVPSNVGYVAVINSTGIVVKNLQLTENYQGLLIAYSNFTFIQNVTLMNNWLGLALIGSLNNTVTFCTFNDNLYHVFMDNSFGNIIYNNNFLGSVCPVDSRNSANIWDNGYPEGGNFWQFYNGLDFYHGINQNEIGGDGLVDTPYLVDSDNIDRFPLAGRIAFYEAGTWYNKTYYFSILSNVTIASLFFDSNEGPFIKLSVSIQNGLIGFCRVAIPNDVLWVENGKWKVEAGNESITFQSYADEDCNYVYLTFDWSSGTILIQGSEAISERLSFMMLLIVLTASVFHVILIRKHRVAVVQSLK